MKLRLPATFLLLLPSLALAGAKPYALHANGTESFDVPSEAVPVTATLAGYLPNEKWQEPLLGDPVAWSNYVLPSEDWWPNFDHSKFVLEDRSHWYYTAGAPGTINLLGAYRYTTGAGVTIALAEPDVALQSHPLLASRMVHFTAEEVAEKQALYPLLNAWGDPSGLPSPIGEFGWNSDPSLWQWSLNNHANEMALSLAKTAPDAKILSMSRTAENLVSINNVAMRFAADHARVINCSYGPVYNSNLHNHRPILPHAFYAAGAANQSWNADLGHKSYTISGMNNHEAARFANVIVVGALELIWRGRDEGWRWELSAYTNYGANTVHIYAPDWSTSDATTKASAAAALGFALNPDLTPAQMKQLMIETARVYDGVPQRNIDLGDMVHDDIRVLDVHALVARIYADMYPAAKVYDFADKVLGHGWQYDDDWGWFRGYADTNWVYHVELGWVWIIAEPDTWRDVLFMRMYPTQYDSDWKTIRPTAPRPRWFVMTRPMAYYVPDAGWVWQDFATGAVWLYDGKWNWIGG